MFGFARAPDFDRAGLRWFNVEKPLRLADLRGRLVVLDFWTFCCINCIQILPTLAKLEEAFPDSVTVIGIHSPKFDAERRDSNLVQAIERLGIRHPVIQDSHMVLWDEYCVRAWPTLVLISPQGRIIGQLAGEPDPEALLNGIGAMIEQFRSEGSLKPGALPLPIRALEERRFRFPGKIKPLPGGGAAKWILADSGHHQIALLDSEGREVARYGAGHAGFQDGGAEEASFNNPQGLIADEKAIYVADTGNHAIRRIDRASGRVATLAGNGHRGMPLARVAPGKDATLASVWDLELSGHRLFFANAGTHQIGEYDLGAHTVKPLAGTGGENIRDGAAEAALLAQPSGLALCPTGTHLYFADAETSAIRRVSLACKPQVETLVGKGLFDFGDANGGFESARFQHPLGLAVGAGKIAVADSYNHRIRLIDLERRAVSDLDAPSAAPACSEKSCAPIAELDGAHGGEPAGIVFAGPDRLLVSATNHHQVMEFDLANGKSRVFAG